MKDMNDIKDTKIQSTKGMHPLVIIGALFFVFGFITWLSSVLIPYLQIACELNNFQAYLVAFAFYISYFVMALPSGWVLRQLGFKKGLAIGLLFVALGSLLFIPAAIERAYPLFLLGLFVQGAGLALLQTAANPYVTILGPEKSAAKRMSIMGICNGVAGIVAPAILGAIILDNADGLAASIQHLSEIDKNAILSNLAHRVIVPYLIMGIILTGMAFWIYRSGLPEVKEPPVDIPVEDERFEIGQVVEMDNSVLVRPKTSIRQFPHLLLGVFTLFLYVGVEVIAGNTIIKYGAFQNIPLSYAMFFTSFTLTGMLVGYFIGIICIPKYFTQKQALQYSAIFGCIFVLLALATDGLTSVVFVALLGLSNSLMYPSIWPLAISGLGDFTKSGSSLLVMAISGGAVLPLIYGWLADHFNAQQAYWLVIPCYLVIYYYAVKGHRVGRGKINVDLKKKI
ncbi:MAG TPA: sugar MFS transporter [Arachidicoccus sp.]|nr:sugar MFS transporter [Arachidicoccus sp.]